MEAVERRIKPGPEARYYGTGRRKEAVARVWLIPGGTGRLWINTLPAQQYLPIPTLETWIKEPLVAAGLANYFDIWCTVKGGGKTGQAGAIRHGIARALLQYNPDLRPILRKGGFLTRDPRVRERKKYGQHGARRGHQTSKR